MNELILITQWVVTIILIFMYVGLILGLLSNVFCLYEELGAYLVSKIYNKEYRVEFPTMDITMFFVIIVLMVVFGVSIGYIAPFTAVFQ